MLKKSRQASIRQPRNFSGLLKITLILFLLISTFWSWRLLHSPRFMPIKQVQLITTYQHVDQKTLQSIITPYVVDNGLFTIRVDQLKQQLLQQPWINSVLIKRIWPDKIEIDIAEQQALAVWNKDNLINPDGEIFSPPKKTFPNELPQFNGPDDQQELVVQQFKQLNTLFSAIGLQINNLNLNSRGSWQVGLNNGFVIMLGRTDIQQRVARFINVYTKTLADHTQDILSVDLRYPDGVAVEWRDHKVPGSTSITS